MHKAKLQFLFTYTKYTFLALFAKKFLTVTIFGGIIETQ